MAYEKTVWDNDVTAVDETNMNKIEDGLFDQDARITVLEADSGWLDLVYINDWFSVDEANYDKAQYRKIGTRVYLRGLVKRANTVDSITRNLATLPSGYRPLKYNYLPSNNSDNAFMTIDITPDGKINVTASVYTANSFVSLAGISFTTD